jgi:molecular chaperone Hsp31 and glyoxalase 3
MWAMPKQEQVVLDTFQKYADKLKNPLKLADILENAVGKTHHMRLYLFRVGMVF